jgi:hypothetical protein
MLVEENDQIKIWSNNRTYNMVQNSFRDAFEELQSCGFELTDTDLEEETVDENFEELESSNETFKETELSKETINETFKETEFSKETINEISEKIEFSKKTADEISEKTELSKETINKISEKTEFSKKTVDEIFEKTEEQEGQESHLRKNISGESIKRRNKEETYVTASYFSKKDNENRPPDSATNGPTAIGDFCKAFLKDISDRQCIATQEL